MNILMVHVKYTLRGGEDEVYEAERDSFRQHGHQVVEYIQDNKSIQGAKPWVTGIRTIWSQQDYKQIRACIRDHKIEIVAVHNFFPLISPAVYYAAKAEGVPVVQTLHNFRLICPSAFLLRDGRICEDCVGKPFALPGVVHACYRGSRLLSAGVAGMISVHKLLGTWDRMVTRYIALSPHMREKFIEGGFAPEKIAVKPNFREDKGVGAGDGNYFLFVGRLSPEKGVHILLRAWKLLGPQFNLRIVGTGPEELSLRAQASSMPNVTFLGEQPKPRVLEEMGRATALVFPSLWYEGYPLVILESLSAGTPVIASDLGALKFMVQDGRTGCLTPPGDPESLAQIVSTWNTRPELRSAARASYEESYTPERSYKNTLEIYSSVLGHS